MGVGGQGRVASHYYIKHASIITFNELLKQRMNEAQVRYALPDTCALLPLLRDVLYVKPTVEVGGVTKA